MDYVELYKQCNIHLVESDKKRDQIIAFFTTVVGAFVVLANNESQVAAYFLLALVILGFVLGALLVQYRKWHIRYVNSGRILANIIAGVDATSSKAAQELKSLIDKDLGLTQSGKAITQKWLRRYFQGVEVLTYQAFLLVAFVPVHFSIQQSGVGIHIAANWAVPFIFNLAVYLLMMNSYAVLYLSKDFRTQTPFALWVLPKAVGAALTNSQEAAEPSDPSPTAA